MKYYLKKKRNMKCMLTKVYNNKIFKSQNFIACKVFFSGFTSSVTLEIKTNTCNEVVVCLPVMQYLPKLYTPKKTTLSNNCFIYLK